MTSRFDIERAVLASDLPKLSRLLMLVLLTHADVDPVSIPPKFTPSLTGLARESDMGRNTVQATLRKLEIEGWVIRRRPAAEQSRKGVRTRYELVVPVDAQGIHPVDAQGIQLDAQGIQGGCTCHLPVDAQSTLPRCPVHPMSIHPSVANQSIPRTRADDEIAAVIEAVRNRTGKTVDEYHAVLVIKQLVDGRNGIRDRVKYLTGAIAKDPDPCRFLPTSTPKRFRKEDYQ